MQKTISIGAEVIVSTKLGSIIFCCLTLSCVRLPSVFNLISDSLRGKFSLNFSEAFAGLSICDVRIVISLYLLKKRFKEWVHLSSQATQIVKIIEALPRTAKRKPWYIPESWCFHQLA